jgi:raffinose/stachyose/melibiose transport system permease protein
VIAVVVFVIPFLFILVTAAKDRATASHLEFTFPLDDGAIVQNLGDVISARNNLMVVAMRNSLILTVASVTLIVFLSAMVGYVLQRRRDRLGAVVSALILAGLVIPPAIVPTIYVLQSIGLFKTLPGLILVEVAFLMPFSVLIFRTFVSAIPRELDEAAIIDGATPTMLFLKVMLPLLRPAIITVIVVSSVAVYNDFVNPLYFLPGNDNATVQLTLFNFQSQFNTLEPAVRRRAADHDPATDHVHLLPAADCLRDDGRRGQGLMSPPQPGAASASSVAVVDLRCQVPPGVLAIGRDPVRLTWRIEPAVDGLRQAAYEIEASDAADFSAVTATSAILESPDQVGVPAPGAPLRSREVRFFRARISPAVVDLVEPAPAVEAGLLDAADWEGRAVTLPDDPGAERSSPSPLLRREFSIEGDATQARLYVTSLGVHRVFINGEAASPDLLAPGWTTLESG